MGTPDLSSVNSSNPNGDPDTAEGTPVNSNSEETLHHQLVQNDPEPGFTNNTESDEIACQPDPANEHSSSGEPSTDSNSAPDPSDNQNGVGAAAVSKVLGNEDLLHEILKRVTPFNSIFKCSSVCRFWHDVVKDITRNSSSADIKEKYESGDMSAATYFSLRNLDKNLLRDPQLQEAVVRFEYSICFPKHVDRDQKWCSHGEFTVENPNNEGTDTKYIPRHVLIQNGCTNESAFVAIATTAGSLIQYQDIILGKAHITRELMDRLKPVIVAEEWVGTRYDCGSVYRLTLQLFGESNESPICEKWIKVRQDVQDSISYGPWRKVVLTVKDYPPGVTRIRYIRSGRDTKMWEGFYGAKLAFPNLSLVLPKKQNEPKSVHRDFQEKREHSPCPAPEAGKKKSKNI